MQRGRERRREVTHPNPMLLEASCGLDLRKKSCGGWARQDCGEGWSLRQHIGFSSPAAKEMKGRTEASAAAWEGGRIWLGVVSFGLLPPFLPLIFFYFYYYCPSLIGPSSPPTDRSFPPLNPSRWAHIQQHMRRNLSQRPVE